MNYKEWSQYMGRRSQVINENRRRRMSNAKLPALEVPPKLPCPQVPIAYTPSGDYIGRIMPGQEPPNNAIIKYEDAIW